MNRPPAFPPMSNGSSGPPETARYRNLRGWTNRGTEFLRQNEKVLWWLHSAYALLFGVGIMWLGTRDFTYIRIAVWYIAFIWLSSLFLPVLVKRQWISPKWRERIRLAINYFNRSFYQQVLFFLLPIYYSSTTFGSRNVLFFVILVISALLSTMDVVYDQYLSVRWRFNALFFMFNLFACINVMLPVLWSLSNRRALWISAALAFGGFASMVCRLSGLKGNAVKLRLSSACVFFVLLALFFPPFIPPAPLKVVSAEFGTGIQALQVVGLLDRLPTGPAKIVVVTAIQAPLGLHDNVRHRWVLDGKVLFASRYYDVTGVGKLGYRLWTQVTIPKGTAGRSLLVDVETEGGQLIGRTYLKN
jgi:hypothetical protein